MGRNIELLAAGIVRDIWFRSLDHRNTYLKRLDDRKINYQIMETLERDDGSVIIRLLQQYNSSDLIQI